MLRSVSVIDCTTQCDSNCFVDQKSFMSVMRLKASIMLLLVIRMLPLAVVRQVQHVQIIVIKTLSTVFMPKHVQHFPYIVIFIKTLLN